MAGIKTPDCEGNKENNNERSNSNSDIDDQQENVLENGHGDNSVDNSDEMSSPSGSSGSEESSENGDAGEAPESPTTENGTEEKTEQKKEDDQVLLIQDTGFCIKMQVPGMQPFDLPVSSMEMVQEIVQVLMDREDTCHRTCMSLQVNGNTLDNFAELKNVEGLVEGATVKVVEELYTVREARIHVRHIRDLLKSIDYTDSFNGVDGNSLSFLNTVTAGDILDKKAGKPDSLDCTPPDYIMPGNKDRPLQPLLPGLQELKAPKCIKVLTYSGWNPPPGNRKLHGDLLYLYIVTLEDKKYHITASPLGFYINQSTEEEFNPKAAAQKHLSHSLVDLLNQISPLFKKNFSTLLKKRSQKHPFERVPTPYQVYTWLSPSLDHPVDSIRGEDAFATRLGYEENIPGQTRDWNEEIQTVRELPRKNLPERIIRERAIFKVHSDFVSAAVRGAMAVIDGNVMAINPGDDSKMQMFIWNNLFFSLGFDVKDHYKKYGGDAAAYAAPANDLQGVRAYSNLDMKGLYTLGTVIVDYRGYRVTAQSIIPGILEREQEQSVVYGSVDFGKTVVTCDKYREMLTTTAALLKVKPHKVINDKDEEIELFSAVDCKGIIGNDKRHYILDLLRTFPPDVNYLPCENGEIELNQVMKDFGFPLEHRHKLVCLRQELIEAFIEAKYIEFVKAAAAEFQALRAKKEEMKNEEENKDSETEKSRDLEEKVNKLVAQKEKSEDEDTVSTADARKFMQALTETEIEECTKDIVKKAARKAGSISDTEFNICFNPDVLQPCVKHADPEGPEYKRDLELVKEAAEFIVTHQMPRFIRDCLDHVTSPIDGYTLVEALHHRGINVRYLGKVTDLFVAYPQLCYIQSIAIGEMITRAAKHLYQTYMHSVEQMSLSSAVSHFLNCFLGSYATPHGQVMSGEFQKNSKKKKSKSREKFGNLVNTEWASETPKTLWKKILEEIKTHFDYTLDSDSIDAVIEKYTLQKISILRSFCSQAGIQVMLKEYNFDNKHKQCFYEEDIVNTFPVIKNIHPKATDAYNFFTTGQQKIQQGLLREGYEMINEALNLLNNVYGAMHPEIAACLRLLARLNYVMGEYGEALQYQQRAVLMSERVLGIDHPNTMTEYAHFALYCFAGGQIPSALRLMYRARYLALLCFGEEHPEVALFDSNIGLILHAAGQYELSLRFLDSALRLNKKFYSVKDLKVAMGYHLVARTHSCLGDFRTALQNEKEAYSIYKSMLGEQHERTKESSECLKHLTQQAVEFQKKMNEIYKGSKDVNFPSLQIQVPSQANILEILNAINGIELFHILQLSPEEVRRLQAEYAHKQRVGGVKITEEKTNEEQTDITNTEPELKQPIPKTGGGDASVNQERKEITDFPLS